MPVMMMMMMMMNTSSSMSQMYEYQDLIYVKIKPESNSGNITAIWSKVYFVSPPVVAKHKRKN